MIQRCIQFQVDPSEGTVGFGSGLHGWAFSLKQFAEIYATKMKIEPMKLMKRLWGDQFYNTKDRKWKKESSADTCRGFNMFVLDPIYKVSKAILKFCSISYARILFYAWLLNFN